MALFNSVTDSTRSNYTMNRAPLQTEFILAEREEKFEHNKRARLHSTEFWS